MSRPAIITDTDASLPTDIAEWYGIRQVPINIYFGQESLKTGVEIDDSGLFAQIDRGGRIGGASRLMGSAPNLKPILTISDGAGVSVARIHTRRKALAKLVEFFQEQPAGAKGAHMAVLHVAAAGEAARLGEQLDTAFDPVGLPVAE